MVIVVGNDQVWFQSGNGFQVWLCVCFDGLLWFQVCMYFGQDVFCIVIVGNIDWVDVYGGQCIGE